MSFYKFDDDDLFVNTILAEPQYRFYIHSGTVYIDNLPHQTDTVRDTVSETVMGVPKGYINLYEYNVDRPAAERVYPFIYKDGSRNYFKSETLKKFDTQYLPGDILSASYNMSSSISRIYVDTTGTAERRRINALRNTLNYYTYLSPHYAYSSMFGDKSTQTINLVSIPSIFFGTKIKKGTVKMSFYESGSLVGQLEDKNYNGELIQTLPSGSTGSGSCAGVVLYNEGFIALTGSWDLNAKSIQYDESSPTASKWVHWGFSGNDGNAPNSTSLYSSFLLEYSGTTETQTLTMLAHAPYGELNHSNNPTFLSSSDINKLNIIKCNSGSHQYIEPPATIKNVVSASYTDLEPTFEKVTYITKVGIYDEDKNLIGIAKLASPIEKTEDTNYTFKIKLDI